MPVSQSSENLGSDTVLQAVCATQLRFGWCALAIFMLGGLILETLHGFKVGWYLDVGYETRRLMFQLAHAHGSLLAIINIAFAVSLGHLKGREFKHLDLASRSLKFASILMPGGFFAGGVIIHDGDPGLGIIAAPLGALAAILSAVLTWRAFRDSSPASGERS